MIDFGSCIREIREWIKDLRYRNDQEKRLGEIQIAQEQANLDRDAIRCEIERMELEQRRAQPINSGAMQSQIEFVAVFATMAIETTFPEAPVNDAQSLIRCAAVAQLH
jgi:hypothetical protein